MVSETIVSLEIAHTGKMIWWPEIAARLKDPHRSIPVHIEHQFDNGKKTADFDYYNDSNGPLASTIPMARPASFNWRPSTPIRSIAPT